MALTVCFKCDKSYLVDKLECPHCGCHNFFNDDDTVVEAVNYLCEDLKVEAKKKKEAKFKELRNVRWWQAPPRWMRWLIWFWKN